MVKIFDEKDLKDKNSILDLSGNNFSVKKRPVCDETGAACNGDYYRTVRTDTGKTLGVVKSRYEIYQNSELLDLAESLVTETGLGHISSAGNFKGGKKVFFNIGIPDENHNGDRYKKYLMFASGHSGEIGIEGLAHMTRIICENTFNAALRNSLNKFSLKHTKNFREKLEQAKRILDASLIYFQESAKLFNEMKNVSFSETQLTELVSKVYGFEYEKSYRPTKITLEDVIANTEGQGEKISTRNANILEAIIELSHTGKGTQIDGVKGTAYGAYNAITEYLDHHSTVRAHNGRDIMEVRQESIYDGSIAQKSQSALDNIILMTELQAIAV
jgi:phage/plasmid-like protein (TIGR03299 family)